MRRPLTSPDDGIELDTLLSNDEMVALAEAFGGTRLYIPLNPTRKHPIAVAIGLPAAQLLSAQLGCCTLRIPLFRNQRAAYYREKGLTTAMIARKLGMTESGVERLLKRNSAGER